jgi:hypothetical protein
LRALRANLSDEVSIVVTADHGVLDVSSAQHIVFNPGGLTDGVSLVGGEPRCLQLYVEPDAHVDDVARAWRHKFSDVADVMTRDQIVANGLLGDVALEVVERLGDVFVLARANNVFYDGRETNTSPQRMVGQHGGLSDVEMKIPLVELQRDT